MKNLLATALAVLVLAPGVGCKLLKRGQADDSDPAGDPGKGTTTSGDTKGGKASAGCALPEDNRIVAEVTLKKGCVVTIKDHVVIESGGVLKVEAGAKLLFSSNTYIDVHEGKLSVVGTEKEPVVLTSANKTQAAGDWAGIFVGEGIMAGSELSYARVEYAGADAHGSRGAITMQAQKSGKRLAITNSTFANNDRAAISAENEKGAFARFERNTFKSNKVSLSVPAPMLASIGAGNTLGDPLETWGEVTESCTWQAFGVPVLVKDHLTVGNDGSAPVLTIPAGTTLKFAGGTFFSIGEKNGGGLIAPKVTFTSANATPHAGDWAGLFFYKRTSNVNLEGAVVEYAGQDAHGARAALTFQDVNAKEARGFKMTGLAVKNSEHAAMASIDHDCGEFAKQITAAGVPVCRKD